MKRIKPVVMLALTALLVASLGLSGCAGVVGSKEVTLTPVVTVPVVGQDGVLRVGIDTTNAPFAGRSNSEIIGIDVDIAADLATKLGLRLELTDIAGQDPDALLEAGSVYVVMGLEPDESHLYRSHLVGPYLLDGPAIFTVQLSNEPEPFSINNLVGATVAAQQNSLSSWKVGELIGANAVQSYPSLDSAFDDLANGLVSYAASDAIVGSFLAVNYKNVTCVGLLDNPLGAYMGVASTNLELGDALTAALRRIRDNGELKVLVTKWLGPVSTSVVISEQAIVASGGTAGAGNPVVVNEQSTAAGAALPDPSLADSAQ